MVESLNSKVDLTIDATSYMGMPEYGKLMVGNKGFEFYNSRNEKDFIQIPWGEVDTVIVSIVFGGRWIPRYALRTKRNGTFSFASKKPQEVLRSIRKYVGADKLVQSLSMKDVLVRSFSVLFAKIFHRNK